VKHETLSILTIKEGERVVVTYKIDEEGACLISLHILIRDKSNGRPRTIPRSTTGNVCRIEHLKIGADDEGVSTLIQASLLPGQCLVVKPSGGMVLSFNWSGGVLYQTIVDILP